VIANAAIARELNGWCWSRAVLDSCADRLGPHKRPSGQSAATAALGATRGTRYEQSQPWLRFTLDFSTRGAAAVVRDHRSELSGGTLLAVVLDGGVRPSASYDSGGAVSRSCLFTVAVRVRDYVGPSVHA
jgi:hypothetical protein